MKITEEQLKKCVAEYEAGDSMAVLAKRYEEPHYAPKLHMRQDNHPLQGACRWDARAA